MGCFQVKYLIEKQVFGGSHIHEPAIGYEAQEYEIGEIKKADQEPAFRQRTAKLGSPEHVRYKISDVRYLGSFKPELLFRPGAVQPFRKKQHQKNQNACDAGLRIE